MDEYGRKTRTARVGILPPAGTDDGCELISNPALKSGSLCDSPGELEAASTLDHFIERDGLTFAGTHLILDLWNASNLDDLAAVERILRRSADSAGATLLRIELHSFAPTGGVTGVAVLAESHISIHTWPERSYAAIDIFMCGEAKPHKAVGIIRQAFLPETLTLMEHKRGLIP